MQRLAGIAFGVVTHLVFGLMVWQVFWFLKGATHPTGAWALPCDAGLALQFAVCHSLLLRPSVREWLTDRWIPAPFYGCAFALLTSAQLLLVSSCWQSHPRVLWQAAGPAAIVISILYYGSWVGLFYSLWLNGLGYQTGFTPWWGWVRHRAVARRAFQPRGIYNLMRHPVYLSLLGLVWFTPVVTLDRGLLIAIWTAYTLVGSQLKDARLVHYLGRTYQEYQSRVPGYPGFPWGRLARVPLASGGRKPPVSLRRQGADAPRSPV